MECKLSWFNVAAEAERNLNSHMEQQILVSIDYYMNYSLWIITCLRSNLYKNDMADINVILHNRENTLAKQILDDSLS